VSFDTHTVGPSIDGEYAEACSLRWARRLYPDADDHKLSTLIFALGLPRSAGAHRVLADVMSTFHLAKHLCERAGLTLRQYAEASADPFLISRMSFGKHRGELMTDVPRSYLGWMQRSMDLDQDLAHTIKTILNK
jgi:exodeoxyribonuclease X